MEERIALFILGIVAGLYLYRIIMITQLEKKDFSVCDVCKWKNRQKKDATRMRKLARHVSEDFVAGTDDIWVDVTCENKDQTSRNS